MLTNEEDRSNVGESVRLPDFIISGAMKCGTSSLHHLLASHPQVYMPDGEQLFFAIDDFEEHPEFFARCQDGWNWLDYDADFDRYLQWYQRFFAAAGPQDCIGEDSPAYLSSGKSPERIRKLIPDVKLIFLLRDPVERAWSHYWHWVWTGRTFLSFEDAIRHAPTQILDRGLYYRHLSRYLKLFPKEQIRVYLFEEFVKDPRKTAQNALEFLGQDPQQLPSDVESHRNSARIPRFHRLQLFRNYVLRDLAGRRYLDWLPEQGVPPQLPLWKKIFNSMHHRFNGRSDRRPEPMQDTTREYLGRLYRRENAGLDGLLERDLGEHWRSWRDQVMPKS